MNGVPFNVAAWLIFAAIVAVPVTLVGTIVYLSMASLCSIFGKKGRERLERGVNFLFYG